ncbi:uncharacterized protein LOC124919221 [Impatiens glandulifera]|uniref:uncharacterized protein LOC124919221 n=1 Tax=Impatiens glandulifera TaxID=253017 RepID=UPI001FB05416|nr:uncharacterized protein LOC124919221 [Impatiens glandulifera]
MKKEVDYKKASSRFLITVNVIGSSGSIKFVVNEDDRVAGVIEKVLKLYDRQNRLPLLGSCHVNDFHLFPLNGEFNDIALNTHEKIGNKNGVRNFVMSKKVNRQSDQIKSVTRSNNGWRAWLNNTFKIIPTI